MLWVGWLPAFNSSICHCRVKKNHNLNKMSTDPKQYAPLITQNLDFATTEVYLLKHGVLSVVEYDRLRKALQSGSSTNGEVVHQILPRILKKAREFYRALRDHVNDQPEDVHPSNSELFYQLPENFVSI